MMRPFVHERFVCEDILGSMRHHSEIYCTDRVFQETVFTERIQLILTRMFDIATAILVNLYCCYIASYYNCRYS